MTIESRLSGPRVKYALLQGFDDLDRRLQLRVLTVSQGLS